MVFLLTKFLIYLVYPLSVGLFLLFIAYIFFLLRKRVLCHFFFILGLLTLYLFSIDPVANALIRPLERMYHPMDPEALYAGKADAIVVLAGDVRKKVFPRSEAEVEGTRVIKGVRLFKKGAAPIMVMAGGSGYVFDPTYKGALVMKELAVELGVPEGKIVVETQSRNTQENAAYTKRLLDRIKAKKVFLVTSAFHLARAQGLFRKQGVTTIPVASDYYATDEGYDPLSFIPDRYALEKSTYAIKEYIGLFVYKMMGWI